MSQAYCIKCKQKTELKDGKIVYFKNGVPAERGTCATCGSKTSRILAKAEKEALKVKVQANLGSDTDA